MTLTTLFFSITGVFIVGFLYVLLSLKYSKTGTLEDGNYVGKNYYKYTGILYTLLVLTCLFTNPDYATATTDKETEGVVMGVFGVSLMVIVYYIITACTMLSIYGKYSSYKDKCLATGIELKDHIGKFVITTRKDSWVKSDDPAKWELCVNRIIPVHTWTDIYAQLSEVTTISHLTQLECNKGHITKLTKEYFDNRKHFRHNYLVESDNELLDTEDRDKIEIIII